MTTHTPGSSGAEPPGEATPEPVQAYIDRIACEHRPLFDRLHRLIRTAQPHAHPGISYGMLCYRAGARRLYLGAWKHGLSIYGWPQGQETELIARHPQLKTSKGTLQLTPATAAGITDPELAWLIRATLTDPPHSPNAPA
jgi:Domain of unknown function (DU1801)